MKARPVHDAVGTPVKPGDVFKADDRLCLVLRRVLAGRQSVPGIEDLDVVELQINEGASSSRETAAYGRVIGHLDLKALR